MRMATSLSLDSALVERAFELSGELTRSAAVTLALQQLVARRGRRSLVELMGTLDWGPPFDFKAERSRR